MAYGVLYTPLLIAAGGAIVLMAIYGWLLEGADARESDLRPARRRRRVEQGAGRQWLT